MPWYRYDKNLITKDATSILRLFDINGIKRTVGIGQAVELSPAQLDIIDNRHIFTLVDAPETPPATTYRPRRVLVDMYKRLVDEVGTILNVIWEEDLEVPESPIRVAIEEYGGGGGGSSSGGVEPGIRTLVADLDADKEFGCYEWAITSDCSVQAAVLQARGGFEPRGQGAVLQLTRNGIDTVFDVADCPTIPPGGGQSQSAVVTRPNLLAGDALVLTVPQRGAAVALSSTTTPSFTPSTHTGASADTMTIDLSGVDERHTGAILWIPYRLASNVTLGTLPSASVVEIEARTAATGSSYYSGILAYRVPFLLPGTHPASLIIPLVGGTSAYTYSRVMFSNVADIDGAGGCVIARGAVQLTPSGAINPEIILTPQILLPRATAPLDERHITRVNTLISANTGVRTLHASGTNLDLTGYHHVSWDAMGQAEQAEGLVNYTTILSENYTSWSHALVADAVGTGLTAVVKFGAPV